MVDKSDYILLTGATGFIGSYISRYLIKEGYTNIIGMCRETSTFELLGKDKDSITWSECDILDLLQLEKLVQRVDVIIHAAALVSFRESDNQEMIDINKRGTANLVNAALTNGIKKFIHISSVAALGKSKPNEQISEASEWVESKLNSPYAISKKASEMEVWRAHSEGLNVNILNPSIVFGAGFWDRSSVKIFGNMKRGQLLYPKGSSGFVDVRDVAKSVIILLKTNHNGEKFLLNGANMSYKNLMDDIAEIYQVSKPKYKIADWIIPISWRLMKLYSFLFRKVTVYSRYTVVSSSQNWSYNNGKSRERLGLEYISLDQTISETAQCFLESSSDGKSYGILKLL